MKNSSYLVKDVVSFFAGSNLNHSIEALGGFINQHIPAAAVVFLSRQSHDLKKKKRRGVTFCQYFGERPPPTNVNTNTGGP